MTGAPARLDAALDRLLDAPASERSAVLERLLDELGDDPLLVTELGQIAASLALASGLDRPAASLGELATTLADAEHGRDDLEVGDRVGAYRIVGQIGAGGMGSVYRAERADGAFERAVAVKVVREGRDVARLSAQFERERAILARLDHPGITTLLDAGTLADGRPYLVMELVDGIPLPELERAPVRTCVGLVLGLCEAVAYAHERLVVHRDLKPSNVLVRDDGEPVLLDFGIAGLLASQPRGAAADGGRLLSPRWAAPEQLAGGEVGIRADVYGLGLILHALLTGRDHVARDAQGRCPPPSTEIADPRRRRAVAGDLDAILAKALAVDPNQRYASAAALAEDLRRHLAGEAVSVRAGRGYRLGRFVASHRLSLAGLAAGLVLLVVYAVTVTVQSQALARERDRAQAAARRAERLAGFLETILTAEHAAAIEGAEPTVREALGRASSRLEGAGVEPRARVDLLLVTARSYFALGRMVEARARAHDAERLARALGSGARAALIASLRLQAQAYASSQQPEPGRRLAVEAVALALARGGPFDPQLASSLEVVAQLYVDEHPRIAFWLYASALGVRLVTEGPLSGGLAEPLSGLARACVTCANPCGLLRVALRIQAATLGPDHAALADTLQKLAACSTPEQARALLERALAIERAVLGPGHPWTANTLNDLALVVEAEDPGLALRYLDEAREVVDLAFAEGHPRRLLARQNLGAVLRDAGRLREAEAVLTEALELAATSSPGQLLPLSHHLGWTFELDGRLDEAARLYRRGLAACRRYVGPSERIDAVARRLLALPGLGPDTRADACELALTCLRARAGAEALAAALAGAPGCRQVHGNPE